MGKTTTQSASKSNLRLSKIRLKLWRWHRRMGLVSALFVILLATTGILLNHGNGLGLDRHSLPKSLLSFLYGVDTPTIRHFNLGRTSLSQVNSRELFLAQQGIGQCDGELVGALVISSNILVACEQALLFFTAQGELVDKLDILSDIPLPILGLGLCDNQPCWRSPTEVQILNVDFMTWVTSEADLLRKSLPSDPTQDLSQKLLAEYQSEITWERAVQDLHSGRLFGPLGPWLMDLMAILFVVIALTGVVMWTLGRGRKS